MGEEARNKLERLLRTYTAIGVAGLLLAGVLVAIGTGAPNGGAVSAAGIILGVVAVAVLLFAGQQWATYVWNRRK